MKEFYTIKEASDNLKVSKNRVYYYIERKYVVSTKVAGTKVLMANEFNKLKRMVLKEKNYLTPEEYCVKHDIGIKAFYYRANNKLIKTVRVGRKLYVKGTK